VETWNIEEITRLLHECARIAFDAYEAPTVSLKADRSPVTEADTRIEALLAQEMDHPERESYLVGEETILERDDDYLSRAFQSTAWVVDPIDGTAPFSHHLSHWGISIGRMEAGRLVEGAVHLPVTGELFLSDGDQLLYGLGSSGHGTNLAPLSVKKRSAGDVGMIAITQELAKHGTIDVANPVQALGCAVVPMTYLLLGRFLAYVGKVKLWDIAGTLPLLLRAGFVVQTIDGRSMDERVTDEFYELDPQAPRAFGLRRRMVCAGSPEAVEYLTTAIHE